MGKLMLVRVDYEYCNYLREFDSKVMYNHDRKELRPFVGVLFMVNDMKYFAPLSSPKEKHKTMRDYEDFMKIKEGEYGAINFNNMVPVSDGNYEIIFLDEELVEKEGKAYVELLRNQLYYLNAHYIEVINRAISLHNNYINGTLRKSVRKRCCNFLLLEDKCLMYHKEVVNV